MNEELYITHLHQGDENVFRELFEKYHSRLCYFAQSLLPFSEGAEDVVQDVFLIFWRKRTDFHSLQAIKAFLYITVKNHCLNIYKHEKVVKKYADLLPENQEEEEVMDFLMEAEVLENVYQALQKLPEGCRNVLHLSYFEGMKNKEVANYLQVSINTVKTQKQRALHLLRAIMKVTSLLF